MGKEMTQRTKKEIERIRTWYLQKCKREYRRKGLLAYWRKWGSSSAKQREWHKRNGLETLDDIRKFKLAIIKHSIENGSLWTREDMEGWIYQLDDREVTEKEFEEVGL